MKIQPIFRAILLIITLSFSSLEGRFFSLDDPNSPVFLSLSRTQGKGIGHRISYTSLDLLLSPNLPCDFSPFIDLRGHCFDDGRWAANAGIGTRFLAEPCNAILGANIYYDYRETKKKDYHQVGFGLEWINCEWEVRANAYFPIGKTKGPDSDYKQLGFKNNGYWLRKKKEIAFRSGEFELAYRWPEYRCVQFYTGSGAYYLSGHGRSSIGAKIDISAYFMQYCSVDIKATYDNIFNTNVQARFTLTIPLGGKKLCEQNRCDNYFLLRPVCRREIIALEKKKIVRPATNLVTGEPLKFIFVNNTNKKSKEKGAKATLENGNANSNDNGTGTFEDPFNTLVQAQKASKPHDIIYVHAGDETNKGMDQGIVLKDNQMLLGAGSPHHFPIKEGILLIPEEKREDNRLVLPTISNNNGNAIELANCNQVHGINIQASNWGVHGQTINSVSLVNNSIRGPLQGGGIFIENFSGEAIINHNTIEGRYESSSLGINLGSYGSSTANISLLGNKISHFGTGTLLFSQDESQMTSMFSQNKIYQCQLDGLTLGSFGNSTHSAVLFNNCCFEMGAASIKAFSESNFHARILQNEANTSATGLALYSFNKGVLTAEVDSNAFLGDTQHGFVSATSGTGDIIGLRLINNKCEKGSYLIQNNGNGSKVLLQHSPNNEGEMIFQGLVEPAMAE